MAIIQTMTIQEQQKNLLSIAAEVTSGDRRRDYGRPLINHVRVAIKASVTMNRTMTPLQVAWLLGADLKSAREVQTPKWDNTLDDVGYAECRTSMVNQILELGIRKTFDDALLWLSTINFIQMAALMELLWQLEVEDIRPSHSYLMEAMG